MKNWKASKRKRETLERYFRTEKSREADAKEGRTNFLRFLINFSRRPTGTFLKWSTFLIFRVYNIREFNVGSY